MGKVLGVGFGAHSKHSVSPLMCTVTCRERVGEWQWCACNIF
jgi:hypothetical protein